MDSLALYVPSINITNCVTVTLTEKNYVLWKRQFELFLSGQGLLEFVTGSRPPPLPTIVVPAINNTSSEETNPYFITWYQIDQINSAWLLGSLSEDLLGVVVNCNTSKDVWMALAIHFSRVSPSKLFELQRKLQTVSKSDKIMDEYLKIVKALCEQLEAAGHPVTENMKIFAAHHGLGREYEPIKTSIEDSLVNLPSPTFEDVIPRLQGFEDRLQAYSYETAITPHVAFNTVCSDSPQGYYNNNGRGRGRFGGNDAFGLFSENLRF